MIKGRRSWLIVESNGASEYTPPPHLLARMLEKGLVERVPTLNPDDPIRYRLTERGWSKTRDPHAE